MKTSGCVVVFLLVFIVCSVKADLKVMPLHAIQGGHGGIKLRTGGRKLLREDPPAPPSPQGNSDPNTTG